MAVFVLSLPVGGVLESLGGVWACLAGGLVAAAPPGAWDGEVFLSSEKSCLITSKKLLNGLPTQREREKENRQEMS